MRFFGLFVVGTVAFVVISYFEQVPVLGWLGAVVSVVGRVTLSQSLARGSASSMLTAGMLGAWTGFVGAFSAWLLQTGNLFGLATPGLERVGASFRFVGATLGVVYWALLRAAVCFALAVFARRPCPAQ